MKTGKTMLVAMPLLAFASAAAYATDTPASKQTPSLFERLDSNNDQQLSRGEYQAWSTSSDGASANPASGITKASALIGQDVVGKSGEALGEIKDVVANVRSASRYFARWPFRYSSPLRKGPASSC